MRRLSLEVCIATCLPVKTFLRNPDEAEEWRLWRNIKTLSRWEAGAAGVIIQHMAHPRLLKICFSGVSDISTTISLIDVVKYAPAASEL